MGTQLVAGRVILAGLVIGALTASAGAQIVYVDGDATGAADGTSWEEAFPDLVAALAIAGTGTEVRIAEGTYRPDGGTGDIDLSFDLAPGVTLKGGYAGLGAPDPDLRVPDLFPTVLSGDLLGDDVPGSFALTDDNSRHVVSADVDETWLAGTVTRLDGVVIRGGFAKATGAWGQSGGGLLVVGDGGAGAHLEIHDGLFADNHADKRGGAVFVGPLELTTVITSTQFSDNRARFFLRDDVAGGAISTQAPLDVRDGLFADNVARNSDASARGGAVHVDATTATFLRTTFVDNQARSPEGAEFGGAVSVVDGTARFRSCSLRGNRATLDDDSGFVIGGGGAVHALWTTATPFDELELVDCELLGNESWSGGAIATQDYGSFVEPGLRMAGCRLAGNVASLLGGGVSTEFMGFVEIDSCTFFGNQAAPGWAAGVFLLLNSSNDIERITNTILWEESGNALELDAADGAAFSSVLVDRCCLQGAALFGANGTNIEVDPQLVDPAGPDGVLGTEDDDLRLSPGSPCIDAGITRRLPADLLDLDCDLDVDEPLPLDGDGRARLADDPATPDTGVGVSSSAVVDIGAYEFGAPLPVGTWTTVAESSGLAGISGIPALDGSGLLCKGSTVELRLRNGPPVAPVFLVLGAAVADVPLFGGVLYPQPTVIVPLVTDGQGAILLAGTWSGVVPGIDLWWQAWVIDAAGPAGWSATAALHAVTSDGGIPSPAFR